jgi:hypothetical protein
MIARPPKVSLPLPWPGEAAILSPKELDHWYDAARCFKPSSSLDGPEATR